MNIKSILLACASLVLMNGCDSVQSAYNNMCDREPDSVMCSNQKVTGIDLGKAYLIRTRLEMYINFTSVSDKEQYGEADYWTHNDTVDEKLSGDCEDFAMTFISSIILDGFSADKVRLVLSGKDGEVKHAYVKVLLEDGSSFSAYHNPEFKDISYMQLDNVGEFTKY